MAFKPAFVIEVLQSEFIAYRKIPVRQNLIEKRFPGKDTDDNTTGIHNRNMAQFLFVHHLHDLVDGLAEIAFENVLCGNIITTEGIENGIRNFLELKKKIIGRDYRVLFMGKKVPYIGTGFQEIVVFLGSNGRIQFIIMHFVECP